jgi:hypothetical protein
VANIHPDGHGKEKVTMQPQKGEKKVKDEQERHKINFFL